jgi:uracil-DNA glycosylase family 4
MTKLEKQRKLEKIAREIGRAPCPLRKTALNPVPGDGNPDADILFIGEAPGRNEDITGKPFVGAAGRILDDLLASVRIARADVFITSIEKFRPPKNRDPLPKEVAVCFPFLEEQISVIEPKVIVTLGRHAMHWILERYAPELSPAETTISALHGKKITTNSSFLIIPMYHPAAAIYNRSLMETIKTDFRALNKTRTQA